MENNWRDMVVSRDEWEMAEETRWAEEVEFLARQAEEAREAAEWAEWDRLERLA